MMKTSSSIGFAAFFAAFSLSESLVTAQETNIDFKQLDASLFPEWASLFGPEEDQFDFSWTAYEVTTDDFWDLTLFRLCFPLREEQTSIEKPAVLFMPSAFMDSESWLKEYFIKEPLPLKMLEQGYDVWMGNNRATKYGATNRQYTSSNIRYWDFSFQQMGTSDLPAQIDHILYIKQMEQAYLKSEYEGEFRVSVVTLGNGSLQMFYGLTQMEDSYYSKVLDQVVMLSPCLYATPRSPTGQDPYQFYLDSLQKMYQSGTSLQIFAVNGPTWSRDLSLICSQLSKEACDLATSWGQQGVPMSLKGLRYMEQLAIERRFQEYNTKYGDPSQRQTSLIEPVVLESPEAVLANQPTAVSAIVSSDEIVETTALGSITQQIYFFVASEDTDCTPSQALFVENELVNATVYTRTYSNADKDFFRWANDDDFVAELSDALQGSQASQVMTFSLALTTLSSIIYTALSIN